RLSRDPGAEREARRPEVLTPDERTPTAPVQSEEGSEKDGVRRSDPGSPHDAGVGCGDPLPVAAADSEGGGAPGGPGCAVDAKDLAGVNAEVAPKRGILHLLGPQLRLAEQRQAP